MFAFVDIMHLTSEMNVGKFVARTVRRTLFVKKIEGSRMPVTAEGIRLLQYVAT